MQVLTELATYGGAVALEVAVQEAEQTPALVGGESVLQLVTAANTHFVQAQQYAQSGRLGRVR